MRVRANTDKGGIVPLFPRRDSEPAIPETSKVRSSDLTHCFTEALTRVARELYGEENLAGFLLQQGATESDIRVHVEFELQYGEQLTRTTVVSPFRHLHSAAQLMELVDIFIDRCALRFGDGSGCDQVRVVRAVSCVEHRRVDLKPDDTDTGEPAGAPAGCIYPFLRADGRLPTRIYDHAAIPEGTTVEGPALVESPRATYLVEAGWTLIAGRMGSACLTQTAGSAAPQPLIAATA